MQTLSLSSADWKFRDATDATRWRSATVPGCVHRDLLRHELIPDPFYGTNELDLQWIEQHDWEYRATFRVTTALLDADEVDLVCDGLDTLATVYLNGRKIATSDNMFEPLRLSVRRQLRVGANELRFLFASAGRAVKTLRPEHQPKEFNDSVGRSSVLRKQQCQFGWDWGPRFVTAGIWRDLRLEAWSRNRLVTARVDQTHARDGSVSLAVAPQLVRADRGVTYYVTLSLGDEIVAIASGKTSDLVLHIPHASLWWPNGHGAQPLYTITLTARDLAGDEIG
ncbi:MAG: csxA 1, partial [Verrucomicrobia bacterium]|nr:csxA 1 [Verrucomicrobiota bacterium]